jgi:hypothetical protein
MMIASAVSAFAWTIGSQAAPSSSRSCCIPGAACCDNGGDFCCYEKVNFTLDDKKQETKEVKLTGTLVCGSCKLKESKKCANVLQVKEKDKLVNYWLTDKGNDETYHENICGGGELKDVTVTGAVSEKDGKKMVKASKVDVKK